MKHWRETAEVAARIIRLAELGERAVLATVVQISGSAYRRPGAKFLIERDGKTLGSVSGGCLEADVCEVARSVIDSGTSRLLHYDTGSDDRTVWGLGLGCNGSVDIFVQSASERSALDHLQRVNGYLNQSETFATVTVVDGPTHVGRSILVSSTGHHEGSVGNHQLDLDLLRVASAALTGGVSRVDRLDSHLLFTDVLVAPPTLIVCGAGDDAVPLVAYAAEAGFAVTVADHRSGYLSAERFPAARRLVEARPDVHPDVLGVDARTMVVVKTHTFAHDRDWLRLFLETEASYIGLLGPQGRAAEILRQVGKERDNRVFGPVGLDVGAEGPEQIAISIVAELLAAHARQQPGHLRERGTAIHAF